MANPGEKDDKILRKMRNKLLPIPDEKIFVLHEMARDICFMCIAEMLKSRRHVIRMMNAKQEPWLYERLINVTFAIIQLTEFLEGGYIVRKDMCNDDNVQEQLCSISARLAYFAIHAKEHRSSIKSKYYNLCLHILYNSTDLAKMRVKDPTRYEEPVFIRFEEIFPHCNE